MKPYKENAEQRKPDTEDACSMALRSSISRKQALSVRTVVTAGVIVTSWGPEWDNWLPFVRPGVG